MARRIEAPRHSTLVLLVPLAILWVAAKLGGCNSSAARGAGIPPAVFPLHTSADQRYLQDANGAPFPILGRASWFVLSLSRSDYESYLRDTLSEGFNAVEITAIPRYIQGNHSPFNGRGAAPFLRRLDGRPWSGRFGYHDIRAEAPDFTTPSPEYWSYVDGFLDYCAVHGIAVLMFPAYVGYIGTEEGWMNEMTANGTERMRAYGEWIAQRYRNRKNIIWMLGGDRGTSPNLFSDPEREVERALIAGLRNVPGQASTHTSAEWSGPLATSQRDFGGFITLNGGYGSDVAAISRHGYSLAPVLPTFLLEEPYDEEGPDGNNRNSKYALQPVRRFEWWGWLNSIGGYVAGNGYVWPFTAGSRWRLWPLWMDHLNTRNTLDLAQLNALIRSIRWYELVPDGLAGTSPLVIAGGGTPDALDYVAAAATRDGRLLIAYAGPHVHAPFTIDMTRMRGMTTARWFNPTTGRYLPIGAFPNTGPRAFRVPGDNGTGYSDWVLLLASQ